MGRRGRDADIILKRVYSTLFLGYQESGKFLIGVRNVATVDALWICIYHHPAHKHYAEVMCTYLREASACVAHSTPMGNTRASDSRMSNSTALTQFVFIDQFNRRRGGPRGLQLLS